jgi:tetratricopeptide (TPR) repeat protein
MNRLLCRTIALRVLSAMVLLVQFMHGAASFCQSGVLTSPDGGGFVGEDDKDKKHPSFQASPIEGSTAPSGYSAGASAEDAAVVMARVNRLEEGGLSLPVEPIPDCNRESDLIKAVHARPESFATNHQLGVFYFGHGDIGQSVGYFKSASLIEPLNVNNARWLSLAYVRTGQLSKAIDLGQSLAKQRPGDAAPALLLGEIYAASGDRPKAIAQYLSAADLDASEANLFACGIGLVSLGAAEQARQLFSAGTVHRPASAKLWMGLGIAQNLGDRKAEATRSLMRSTDLDPNYLPAYSFLATLSGASSETDAEIRKRLELLVASNPASAEAHYDYALALWKHARLNPSADVDAQIKAQLKLAIAKDPAFPAAHLKLGEIYQHAGDYAQATTELERAVRLDPGDATAHYRLSQAYRRNNQVALADLELAIFRKMRSAPPQEDDTAQDGVRVYTAQLAKQPLTVSCHEGR